MQILTHMELNGVSGGFIELDDALQMENGPLFTLLGMTCGFWLGGVMSQLGNFQRVMAYMSFFSCSALGAIIGMSAHSFLEEYLS